ncbi:MAG: molybdopterin-dependent oxidoreductase [Desulfobacterales bacterium]|nr:molybdopterin-dependent oxidoreductase [Desulfobacterales bacterium]
MATTYVGKSVPRLDALDKVTGHAVYTADIELPGMLYGAVLRSTLPHARIRSIDTSFAKKMPGVRAVVTGRDFPFLFGTMIKDQPFLALDKVRYIGEPVAAVAAETEALAQEAVQKIKVTYEELPAVFDPHEAIKESAPIIHEHMADYYGTKYYNSVAGSNICTLRTYSLGNMDQGFQESDEIFEDEFFVHAVAHTPMETHAAAAQFNGAGNAYTVWSSTDGPHRRMKELSDALAIPINHVRIISSYSGGGFGGKGNLVAEAVAVALARFTRGRPVKVLFSREEELTASQTRIAASVKLKTGMKKDGTFLARRAELVWDNGAYSSKAPDVAVRGALTVFGPYRIPNIELLSRLVYTNKEISGAYRGYGTTQVTFACEQQMDIIAEKMGFDPLEIRLKNGYVEGDPYINGQRLHSVGLKETLTQACNGIGWKDKKPAGDGTKIRGRGMATTIKGTATPSDSSCFIKLNQDGSVTLICSSVEVGAGQKTVLAQMAADSIGVPLGVISVPNSDTMISPYDFGVTSSRTTFHMGTAVKRAGMKLRKKILSLAAEILSADPAGLDLDNGLVTVSGRDERLDLKSLMEKKFGGKGGTLISEGHFSPAGSSLLAASSGLESMSSIFWKFATHAVEVEVDTETGTVRLVKVAAAHDVGRAINPRGCEQQIEGAVIMGMSNAMLEEFKFENGRIVNDTLADYKLATMEDLPEIVSILVESDHCEAPFGAKGIGEPAAAPTAPAIANAIYDAVGVRIRELPITPEKILAGLRKKERNPI